MIEPRDIEFIQAFWTRRTVIAYSVFAANIIVFLLMAFAGGSENTPTLLAFGAKNNFDIDYYGEIWRFVTPIFIHIGFLHLAFNSYALWIIGPHVEKLYGGPRFLLFWILTGIGGVGASYWYHPNLPSAGASGAIFGMFGVLLVFSLRHRKAVPAFFSKALGKGILLTVAINLAIGYYFPMIDNAAHLGGLFTGGILAFMIPFLKPGESEHQYFKVVQTALVVLVALSFFQVAIHYTGPAISVRNLRRGFEGSHGASLENVLGSFTRSFMMAEQAFEDAEAMLEAEDLRRAPDVSRELKRARDYIDAIPPVSARADALSADLIELLDEEYDYVLEVERTGRQQTDFIGASPQSQRYGRLKRLFRAWVAEEGSRYNNVNKVALLILPDSVK